MLPPLRPPGGWAAEGVPGARKRVFALATGAGPAYVQPMVMKQFLTVATIGTALALLPGCKDSSSPQPSESSTGAPETASTPATPTATNASSPADTIAKAAEAVLGDQARNMLPADAGVPRTGTNAPIAAKVLNEVAKGGDADWGNLLKSVTSQNSDKLLGAIGGDLGKAAGALKQSLGAEGGISAKVDTAVRAALEGKHSDALALYSKLGGAGLTPGQQKLVAEVRDLSAAFWVQKDLSALDGAQGHVATVVNALRKGEVTGALPALKELAQNAALTAGQKDLLGTLVKQYAPALGQAADAVKAKVPELPPVPKLGN